VMGRAENELLADDVSHSVSPMIRQVETGLDIFHAP